MKKLLLTFTVGLLTSASFAQFPLPNSGFENWTGVEPDDWNTNNAHGLCEPVTKSTDSHSGNFAAKGEVLACDPNDYAPNLGTPGGSLFAVSERYTTLNFFYKFNKLNNDVIIVGADLSTASGYPVGTIFTKITSPVSVYTPISIPFLYLPGDSIPSKMAMAFGIQDTITNTYTPGSYFLIDDISLGGFIGVPEIYSNENILLFNNPSDDFISFSLPEINPSNTISVTDVNGRQVTESFHSDISVNKIIVADLANGIYFLTISSAKNIRMKKVVIAH